MALQVLDHCWDHLRYDPRRRKPKNNSQAIAEIATSQ